MAMICLHIECYLLVSTGLLFIVIKSKTEYRFHAPVISFYVLQKVASIKVAYFLKSYYQHHFSTLN